MEKPLEIFSKKCKSVFSFDELQKNIFSDLYTKSLNIFNFNNLPDTISEDYLKLCLIVYGKSMITKIDDSLYCLFSNGNTPNMYYEMIDATSANHWFNNTIERKLDEIGQNNSNAVMVYLTATDKYMFNNESTLFSLIKRTSYLLANVLISINTVLLNTRVQALCVAEKDTDLYSIENTMQELYSGKPYKVIKNSSLLSSLSVNPLTQTNTHLIELIESYQYIQSMFYHNIGINSNFNMKRERLNTSEIETNNDSLKTYVEEIEHSLTKSIEKVNKMFGTDISISMRKSESEKNDILQTN